MTKLQAQKSASRSKYAISFVQCLKLSKIQRKQMCRMKIAYSMRR
jgi:hypothetical protein